MISYAFLPPFTIVKPPYWMDRATYLLTGPLVFSALALTTYAVTRVGISVSVPVMGVSALVTLHALLALLLPQLLSNLDSDVKWTVHVDLTRWVAAGVAVAVSLFGLILCRYLVVSLPLSSRFQFLRSTGGDTTYEEGEETEPPLEYDAANASSSTALNELLNQVRMTRSSTGLESFRTADSQLETEQFETPITDIGESSSSATVTATAIQDRLQVVIDPLVGGPGAETNSNSESTGGDSSLHKTPIEFRIPSPTESSGEQHVKSPLLPNTAAHQAVTSLDLDPQLTLLHRWHILYAVHFNRQFMLGLSSALLGGSVTGFLWFHFLVKTQLDHLPSKSFAPVTWTHVLASYMANTSVSMLIISSFMIILTWTWRRICLSWSRVRRGEWMVRLLGPVRRSHIYSMPAVGRDLSWITRQLSLFQNGDVAYGRYGSGEIRWMGMRVSDGFRMNSKDTLIGLLGAGLLLVSYFALVTTAAPYLGSCDGADQLLSGTVMEVICTWVGVAITLGSLVYGMIWQKELSGLLQVRVGCIGERHLMWFHGYRRILAVAYLVFLISAVSCAYVLMGSLDIICK